MSEHSQVPVVLLHGAWGGAWCWTKVHPVLVAAGHPTVAIDLPGHGLGSVIPAGFVEQDLQTLASSPSTCADLDSAALTDAAISAIEKLHREFGPVAVVGHSLAGVCLSRVGEQIPEKIAQLVYFAALAPLPGGSVADRLGDDSFGESLFTQLPVADPAVIGATRLNFASTDSTYRKTLHDCFYDAQTTPEAVAAPNRLMSPDTPWQMYSDVVDLTPQGWGSVSRSWIRATEDRAVPIAYQDATIALLDEAMPANAFKTFTLETGHMALLTAPDQVASAILSAVGTH